MRKIAIVTLITIATISIIGLKGCKTEPKTYGLITDYSNMESEDYRIVYAFGKDGCYTDGSFDSNMMFNNWVREYEKSH